MIHKLPSRPLVSENRLILTTRVVELQAATVQSLVVRAPSPAWEAIVRKADPHAQARRDRALAAVFEHFHGQPWREHLATVLLNGCALAMWSARRQGLPIMPRRRGAPRQALFTEEVGDVSTPEKAIQYWRERVPLNAEQVAALRENLDAWYLSTLGAAREVTSVVSQAITDLFVRAAAEGMSLSDFRAEFTDLIPAAERNVVETIYRTQLTKSYAAQRLAQIRDAGLHAAPFIQYVSIPDDRRTAICRAMHGYVAAASDPVWNEWVPPNHYNCRSDLSPISYLEAIRRGIAQYSTDRRSLVFPRGPRPYGNPPRTVIDKGVPVDVLPAEGFGLGQKGLSSLVAA